MALMPTIIHPEDVLDVSCLHFSEKKAHFSVSVFFCFVFGTSSSSLFGHKVQINQKMDIDKIRLTPDMCLI